MIPDYYKILNIPSDADIETIKRAYRKRAFVCHPDRGGSHEQMVIINQAWMILSNPVTRANYDAARLHTYNKEFVRRSETDTRKARGQAKQYPKNWNEFEKWLDKAINSVINDFKKAEYGETSSLFPMPTAGKSFTGRIFIVSGGALGLLTAFLILFGLMGNDYRPGIFGLILISIGAWLGKELHENIKDKLSEPRE